jgi:hypothetical protein
MATPLTASQRVTALIAEGLTVHEHAGWRTHNRDTATGKTFGPVIGVLIHHTAGHNDKEICFNGRPDLPGPLCHAWLGKTDGLWMIGQGRTNHAGSVDLDVLNALRAEKAPLPVDNEANADGNDVLYGLEIENLGDGHDPYPVGQYRAAVRWAAAHCRAHGWTEKSVAGHKEVQPGKIDPSVRHGCVPGRRARPARRERRHPPARSPHRRHLAWTCPASPPPRRPTPARRRATSATWPASTSPRPRWSSSATSPKTYAGDGSFGSTTVAAYAKWQRHLGYTGTDANGIPGSRSLTRLGEKTGLFTVIP